jgi:hypothetical protein
MGDKGSNIKNMVNLLKYRQKTDMGLKRVIKELKKNNEMFYQLSVEGKIMNTNYCFGMFDLVILRNKKIYFMKTNKIKPVKHKVFIEFCNKLNEPFYQIVAKVDRFVIYEYHNNYYKKTIEQNLNDWLVKLK